MKNIKLLVLSLLYSICIVTYGEISIIFRCDDYGSDSGTSVAKGIMRVAQESGCPIALGVIPYRVGTMNPPGKDMSSHKVRMLRDGIEGGYIEMLQHGCSHDHRASKDSTKSEFKGVPASEQVELIKIGFDYLSEITGTIPVGFVPPWHTYDENTLKAMRISGMYLLSAELPLPGSEKQLSKESLAMMCLPAGSNLHSLDKVIEVARASGDSNPFVMVLFHGFEFKSPNKDIATYNRLMRYITKLQAMPDVEIVSHATVANSNSFMTLGYACEVSNFLAFWKPHNTQLKKWLNIDLAHLLPYGVYPSLRHFNDVKKCLYTAIAIRFFFVLIIFVFIFGVLVVSIKQLKHKYFNARMKNIKLSSKH